MTPTPVLPSLPEPFVICYEWKDLRNGTRRSFSAAPYNGMHCSNSLALFTAEQMNDYARRAIESLSRAPDRPSDDALWDQTMRERDNYHEWADKLSERISRFIGLDIGEHSSANNPWARAIDMIPRGTLTEALASHAPAEPVAWIQHWPGLPDRVFDMTVIDPRKTTWGSGITYTLLYAHPTESAGPAPAEIVRELVKALRALVDRDFTFFCGEMLGATRKITRDEVLAARAAIKLGESHEG